MSTPSTLPRIRRTWNARSGRMVWSVTELPQNRWGMGPAAGTIRDWRKAWTWCHQQNAKEALL